MDGAIHRAGGPAILEACRYIVERQGRLPAGTSSRYARRPTSRQATSFTPSVPSGAAASTTKQKRLPVATRESIRVADELQLASIAFPAISTGVYGYPVGLAATKSPLPVRPRRLLRPCTSAK